MHCVYFANTFNVALIHSHRHMVYDDSLLKADNTELNVSQTNYWNIFL